MNNSDQHLLPSFIVVGAQKAGTSTLDRWLRAYPQIALPRGKETHFFSDDEKYERGVSWYLRQFADYFPGQIRGEVAPQYLYSEKAAQRMRELLNSPKLIFLLRHPIDRAYSNYLMSVRQGVESLTFVDAIKSEKERLGSGDDFARNHFGYMSRGKYTEQISHYLKVFPDSQMHFALFEDLMEADGGGDRVLEEIVRFIGVQDFVRPDRQIKENAASKPRIRFLRDFLYGHSSIKRYLGKLMPSRDLKEQLAHILDMLNQRPIRSNRPEVPTGVVHACVEESKRLQELTRLDLTKWDAITEIYQMTATRAKKDNG